MEPLRLGVIGCGVIANHAHLPSAVKSELIDLVAVADLIPERVAAAAEKFGAPRRYASGDELLADPTVEAVVLALPAGARTPLARRALAAGKHVLLEKPVARNVAEVRSLLAARGELTVGCCSPRMRLTPSAAVARECVASGVLGEIRVVRARAILPAGPEPSSPPPPWRVSHELNGGGILVNWGCYDLDYLLGILDYRLQPETVLAQTWPLAEHLRSRVDPASDAENHVVALIRCAGGAVINFERGEFVSARRDEAWQILGSHGALKLWLHSAEGKRLELDTSDAREGVRSEIIWEGDDGRDHNTPLLEDFARAIRERRPPTCCLERSLVLQQLTDAIYESAATGRAVTLAAPRSNP